MPISQQETAANPIVSDDSIAARAPGESFAGSRTHQTSV